MSNEYTKDPLTLAKEAERDLNSDAAKKGHDGNLSANHGKGASDSSMFASSQSLRTYLCIWLYYSLYPASIFERLACLYANVS
jgi:hypothetical protein